MMHSDPMTGIRESIEGLRHAQRRFVVVMLFGIGSLILCMIYAGYRTTVALDGISSQIDEFEREVTDSLERGERSISGSLDRISGDIGQINNHLGAIDNHLRRLDAGTGDSVP